MISLVGYTGFVGSNLASQFDFNRQYNSKNIQTAFGTQPDIVVYAGVPAQKFIANKFPEKDYRVIENAIENIKKIAPRKLILISTIDVYKSPNHVDETTPIDTQNLHPYGLNRYLLEKWVTENQTLFEQHLILRLPGLFGKNLKKNFIYDFIQVIPSMLNQEKYTQLSSKSKLIQTNFIKQDNGFYKCMNTNPTIKNKLKEEFKTLGFTALKFTDSRASFQFYNLNNLWGHIQTAMENNITVFNTATEPIQIAELYQYLTDTKFKNHLDRSIPSYNYKTIHTKLFNGQDGYIQSKKTI